MECFSNSKGTRNNSILKNQLVQVEAPISVLQNSMKDNCCIFSWLHFQPKTMQVYINCILVVAK